jgi:hypothetical protein
VNAFPTIGLAPLQAAHADAHHAHALLWNRLRSRYQGRCQHSALAAAVAPAGTKSHRRLFQESGMGNAYPKIIFQAEIGGNQLPATRISSSQWIEAPVECDGASIQERIECDNGAALDAAPDNEAGPRSDV